MAGLVVRYFWRQLAGLAGALLILAAARRASIGRELSAKRRPKKDEVIRATENETLARVPPRDDTKVARPTPPEEESSVKVKQAESVGTPTDISKAFSDSPSEMRRYWVDAGKECSFVVRGLTYMADKKKIPAGPAGMVLVHVDFFTVSSETFHIASKGRCRDRMAAFAKSFADRNQKAPFMFLLNILLPGTPVVSAVMYWALVDEDGAEDKLLRMLGRYAEVPGSGYKSLDRKRTLQENNDPTQSAEGSQGGEPSPPASGAMGVTADDASQGADGVPGPGGRSGDGRSTTEGGDGQSSPEGEEGILPQSDFRNERFKLIPSIVEGPFIVKKAVGNKPALLGRKLRQRYFRGPNYVETDVDVGSSMIAARIVGLCRGYARSLTVELGVCLEGRCEDELPEKCLGVIRLVNLDLDGAEPLEQQPEASGEPAESNVDDRDPTRQPDASGSSEPVSVEPGSEVSRGESTAPSHTARPVAAAKN